MGYFDEYIDGIATALWATAWADWNDELDSEDERHVNLSGCEITEIMPDVPEDAKLEAAILLGRIIQKIGSSPFYGTYKDLNDDHDVGFCLAMQAMGHGVSLQDRYEVQRVELPYVSNPFGNFYDVEDYV